MQERPILFNGPMVVALLNGTKTQTRRPVKSKTPKGLRRSPESCPYGRVGDRLWVRETFTIETNFNLNDYEPPFKDGRPVQWHDNDAYGRYWEQAHYKATDPSPDLVHEDDCRKCEDDGYCNNWKPSLHMPRWASRITLEIVDVTVELVRDISNSDAQAEGVVCSVPDHGRKCSSSVWFSKIWEAVYPGSWERNDWVWVIKFKRITP